uniref:Response regulatory domain-containing protein n=1 Tax=Palpitomonas bilix TaxID=652834 RepID=A0A7S3CZZ4_9EUKA
METSKRHSLSPYSIFPASVGRTFSPPGVGKRRSDEEVLQSIAEGPRKSSSHNAPLLRNYLDRKGGCKEELNGGDLVRPEPVQSVFVLSTNVYVRSPLSLYSRLMRVDAKDMMTAQDTLDSLSLNGNEGSVVVVLDVDSDSMSDAPDSVLSEEHGRRMQTFVEDISSVGRARGVVVSVFVLARYTLSESSVLAFLPNALVVRKPLTFDVLASSFQWVACMCARQKQAGPALSTRRNGTDSRQTSVIEAGDIEIVEGLTNRHILIADDDFLSRTLMERMLKKIPKLKSLNIHLYGDGDKLLEAIGVKCDEEGKGTATAIHPEAVFAIFVDIHMPHVGGLQVIERLSERRIDCPVVLVSGNDITESSRIEYGAFSALFKPFSQADLTGTVEQLISASQKKGVSQSSMSVLSPSKRGGSWRASEDAVPRSGSFGSGMVASTEMVLPLQQNAARKHRDLKLAAPSGIAESASNPKSLQLSPGSCNRPARIEDDASSKGSLQHLRPLSFSHVPAQAHPHEEEHQALTRQLSAQNDSCHLQLPSVQPLPIRSPPSSLAVIEEKLSVPPGDLKLESLATIESADQEKSNGRHSMRSDNNMTKEGVPKIPGSPLIVRDIEDGEVSGHHALHLPEPGQPFINGPGAAFVSGGGTIHTENGGKAGHNREEMADKQRFEYKQKAILVVDDEKICQLIGRKVGHALGFDVLSATNGKEALSLLEQQREVDIVAILMDVHMPIMDGLQCTAEIRRRSWHYSDILIIATTAGARKDECIKAGMDTYLNKPFGKAAVKSILQKWEEGKQNMN